MEKQEHLDLYHQMVMIRRVEERGAELYQQGKIGGFMHLYIGQEAVSTGLVAAREPQDRFITAYRDQGLAINVGIPAEQVMAEVGEGNLNWPAILQACREIGVEWYAVEQDVCRRDPFESLKISYENLRTLLSE